MYHQQGPERLEGFAVPLLSWEDYQAIRQEGAGAAALPAGGGPAAEGRLLEGAQGGGAAGKAAQVQGAAAGAGVGAGAGSSGVRQAEVAPAGAAAAGGDDAASEAGSVDIDELCALE